MLSNSSLVTFYGKLSARAQKNVLNAVRTRKDIILMILLGIQLKYIYLIHPTHRKELNPLDLRNCGWSIILILSDRINMILTFKIFFWWIGKWEEKMVYSMPKRFISLMRLGRCMPSIRAV
jgi:hypothetical protein